MSAPPLPPPPPPGGTPPPAGSPGQRPPPPVLKRIAPPPPPKPPAQFYPPELASATELENYNELLTRSLIDLQELFDGSLDAARERLQLLYARLKNETTVQTGSRKSISEIMNALAKQYKINATDTLTSIRIMQNMIDNWNKINVSPPKENYAVIIQFVLRRLIHFIPDDPDPIDALDALLHYVQYARVFAIGDIVIPSRPILSLDEANRMRAVSKSNTQAVSIQKLGNKPERLTRHKYSSNANLVLPVPLGIGPIKKDQRKILARGTQNAPRANMLRLASPNSGAALARNMRNTQRLINNRQSQLTGNLSLLSALANRPQQPQAQNRSGRLMRLHGLRANAFAPVQVLGMGPNKDQRKILARRTQNAPRANMLRLASPNSGAALARNMRNTRRLQNNRQSQLTGNLSLLSALANRPQQPQAPNRIMRLDSLRVNAFAPAQVLGMGPAQMARMLPARAEQGAPPAVNRAVGAMENVAMQGDEVEYENLGERLEVLKDEMNILVDYLSKPDITEEDRGISMERLRVVDAEYTRLRSILLQNQHQSLEEVRRRAALANAGTEAGRLGAAGAPERPDNGPPGDPPPDNQGGGQRGTRHRKVGRSPQRAAPPRQPRNNRYVPPPPPPPRNVSRKKRGSRPGQMGILQRLLLGASLLAPGVDGPMKVRWRGPDEPGELPGPGVWQGPQVEGVWQGPQEKGVWQGPQEKGVWQGPQEKGVWQGPQVEGVWQGPQEKGVWQGPQVEGVWQGPQEEGMWQGPQGPPPPPPVPIPPRARIEKRNGKSHLIHKIKWGKTLYDVDVVIEENMTGKQLMEAIDAAVEKKVAYLNWPAWKLRAANKGVQIGNVKIMRNNLKVLNRV